MNPLMLDVFKKWYVMNRKVALHEKMSRRDSQNYLWIKSGGY